MWRCNAARSYLLLMVACLPCRGTAGLPLSAADRSYACGNVPFQVSTMSLKAESSRPPGDGGERCYSRMSRRIAGRRVANCETAFANLAEMFASITADDSSGMRNGDPRMQQWTDYSIDVLSNSLRLLYDNNRGLSLNVEDIALA